MGLSLAICVGGGIYLQKKNIHAKEEKITEKPPETIELQSERPDMNTAGKTDSHGKSETFFLKPSPAELMAQLSEMAGLNEDVSRAKYQGLRVMWPVYFFSVMAREGNRVKVLLDVSEDGFGVVVQSELDVTVYPEILSLKSGTRLWLAGEIKAIDPRGTGTIYIRTEHLKFTDSEQENAKDTEKGGG